MIPSGVAMLRVPRYNMTLTRLVLKLGGTELTKAMITDIKIKLGVRTVFSGTGTVIDAINKYKGIQDNAGYLTLDSPNATRRIFRERRSAATICR